MRTIEELFPGVRTSMKPQDIISYMQMRMAEMAENDELYVTECLALPSPLNDLAAKALLGITTQNNKEVHGQIVPSALTSYLVTLRSIEFDEDTVDDKGMPGKRAKKENIRFELPRVPRAGLSKSEVLAGGGSSGSEATWSKPNTVDLESMENEVSVLEAVYALRQSGKRVRRARGRRLQRALWKLEEVHPPNYPEQAKLDEKPKAKPRPRRRKRAEKAETTSRGKRSA